MLRRVLTTAATFAVAIAAANSASAVNLLTDGGFESGTFGGWTVSFDAADDHPQVVIQYGQSSAYPTGAFLESIPTDPLTGGGSGELGGSYGAYFSSDSTAGGPGSTESISQTVALIAGTSYTFGFDYYLPFNGQANAGNTFFTASFAGQQFANFSAASLTGGVWNTISGSFTATTSTPGSLVLTFNAPGTSAFGKDFVIDRVYLAATAGLVPEPASWMMMVAGFGAMGFAMRRKRTAVTFA